MRIPLTPLLRYFRATFPEPRGRAWGNHRIAEAERLLAHPEKLPMLFDESVQQVENEYRNYQPFHPVGHVFGYAKTGEPHGVGLNGTVDVAARLAGKDVWDVGGCPRLSFRFIDREVEITRSRPGDPEAKANLSKLVVDLFLANAHDRTPILCELKLRRDECAFYALVQLLTQASYATTVSQRERLVLFGSRPDLVLREALPGQAPMLDLYILLAEPPVAEPHNAIRPLAIKLSHALIADARISERVGCIAWIEASDDRHGGFNVAAIDLARSRSRKPRLPGCRGRTPRSP